jgi:hypothetical protein
MLLYSCPAESLVCWFRVLAKKQPKRIVHPMRSAAVATLLVATCVVIATAAPTDADGVSIFKGPIGPNPALGPLLTTTGPNKGRPCVDCILVGVTTCCKTWERTEKLLRQMLATNDNLHIAVFDDMSEDDTRARAEAMGLPVIQPPRLENVGLTKMMNLMWRYAVPLPPSPHSFIMPWTCLGPHPQC